MFGHVTKHITAYHHGELSAEDRRRVESHVEQCAACRESFEEIRQTTLLLRAFASSGPVTLPGKPAVTGRRTGFAVALMGAAIVAFSVLAWRLPLESSPELRLGQWLNISSEVTLKVADIGQVRLEPNTRVRLIQDRPDDHRIQMERGTMHALVWAPPKLFFVETPSATATDLGCAYTLTVDDNGDSLLNVTTGLVQLDSKGRSSIVRAGWTAKTRKGAGPGTPYPVETSGEMRRAIDVIDFGSDEAAKERSVGIIVDGAKDNDLITLWHLLPRVDSNSRKRIYDRMVSLAAPPEGATPEGIVDLNPEMMDRWKSHIGLIW